MAYRRRCSRPSCTRHAHNTLTYVYADSTAVLGPLSPHVEPHSYDLCEAHAARLTAPRGWELIRIEADDDPVRTIEDLEAIANAVREERSVPREPAAAPAPEAERDLADAIGEGVQRGHLRSVPPSATPSMSSNPSGSTSAHGATGVLPGMDF